MAKFSSPPAGPLAAGLERDFCRCRLEVLHLFENFTRRHAPRAIFIGYDSTTHTLSPPGIAEALLISVQTDSIRIRVPAPGLLCSASVTYHQLDRYERERYAAIWGAMTYERSG